MSFVLAALCSYQLALSADGGRLEVRAALPAGSGAVLSVAAGGAPFVTSVVVDGVKATSRDGDFAAPACRAGCRLSYAFDLSRAADDGQVAERDAGLIEARPQGFLLRPDGCRRISLRVDAAAPAGFAAGLARRGDAFEVSSDDLPFAAPVFFGPMQLERVRLGERTLQIALPATARPRTPLFHFIAAQAQAVADYFGRLPVDGTLLLVLPERGSGSHGRTLGGGGATVIWSLGDEAPLDEAEWVLAHELVHTGFPDLQEPNQHWAEEGLSTYVEPVARARAGLLTAAKVWRDLADGLPQGAPVPGGAGLDRTPTWGSTYWGGALFWLLADVRIRERTGGARSLEAALRGLAAAGGTIAVRWPLKRTLRVADAATGTRVLEELHASMGERAGAVDLPALLGSLGIGSAGTVDDRAPRANLRSSITSRRAAGR